MRFLQHNSRTKKILAFFTLTLLCAGFFAAALRPIPAFAQSVPIITFKDLPRAWADFKAAVKERAEKAKESVTGNILARTFQTAAFNYASRLGSTVGKSLAEGGKGGKPGFDTRQLRTALNEAREAAVGDMIDGLGKGIGMNLCTPPELRLNLSLGLFNAAEPPKPSCTFREMRENWQNFADDPNLLQRINLSLSPQNTEVGQALATLIQAQQQQEEAKENERVDRLIDRGFKGFEKGVSQTISFPGALVENLAKEWTIPKKPNQQDPKISGKFAIDLVQVGLYNVFTSFTNTALQKLLQNGLFPPAKPKQPLQKPGLSGVGSGGPTSSGSVREPTVATVDIAQTGTEYDLLTEMALCPETGKNIYNCVVDQGFADAIRQELSVADALTKGLLRGTWPFGYWGANADEELQFDQGYAYANVKKLRRARIVPIGWELAAEVVKAQALRGTTLKTVVDCFNNNRDGVCIPFYRLIDPNWILKAPLYSCRVKAPGAILTAGSDTRLDYCADLQDCVVPTEDGSGCKSWGYCTRERNVWRFDGRACEAQFNSCTSYTRTVDNKPFSFNRNTLSYCPKESVGCQWYATEKTGAVQSEWGVTKKIFLNATAETCTQDNAGCTQFLKVVNAQNIDITESAYKEVVATKAKATYDAVGKPEVLHLKGTRVDCRGGDGEAPEANVGCELFTPEGGDLPVATVPQTSDECPSKCAGYDAYLERGTNFSASTFPVYLIPSSPGVRQCSTDAVGCSEFTNLGETTRRGEAREYYTFLRQCQKPTSDSKTYFTYIGTDTTGYQLVTHSLKASQQNGGRAPCTRRDPVTNNCTDPDTITDCTKGTLDCTEFYDAEGNVSRRFLSQTIISDAGCVLYRKTNVDSQTYQSDCAATGGAWDGAKQECTYLALPKASRSCSAAQTGCREYKGNNANNTRSVFDPPVTFEGIAVPPIEWTTQGGGESDGISNDASVGGEHSLRSNVGRIRVVLGKKIHGGSTYILSFYAKGSGELNPVFVAGGIGRPNGSFGRKTLTTTWQEYRLGPVFTTWTPGDTEGIEFNSSAAFFIDNVRLTEVPDTFFLIKNSWTVDGQCSPAGDPGKYAGCRLYRDRKGKAFTFGTNFAHLCKEKFVGCELMIDTKNSVSPYEQFFQNGADEGTGNDNVKVDGDTKAYIVNDPKQYCAAENQGCMALGKPPTVSTNTAFAADKNTIYIKNNPDKYQKAQGGSTGSILCLEPDLGCAEYAKAKGGSDYFKDPGDNVCRWKQYPGTTQQLYGWFIEGSKSTTPDCGDPTADGSTRPTGYARLCPSSENQCTAFIDPTDKAQYPSGRPYYFIDDGSLDSKRAACNSNAVSDKEGCILFLNMNKLDAEGDLIRNYNSSATYAKSRNDPVNPGKSVSAESCNGTDAACDANDVLRVRRDRTCGEWLTCISGTQVFDTTLQSLRNVCYTVGTCQEPSSANATSCGKWKKDETSTNLLDLTTYAGRTVTWQDQEYSGYSVPYRYAMSSYVQFPFGRDPITSAPSEFRIATLVSTGQSCTKDSDCGQGNDFVCKKQFRGTEGVCYKNQGSGTTGVAGSTLPSIAKSCRAYPAGDAPFPGDSQVFGAAAVVEKWQTSDPLAAAEKRKRGFEQANISQQGANAECSYRRVRHKDGETRFWGLAGTYPPGDGIDEERIEYGWQGYCLEEDKSTSINGDPNQHPCLTWFPVDLVQGEINFNASSPEAGMTVKADNRFYCADAERWEYRSAYTAGSCASGYTSESCGGGSSYRHVSHTWKKKRRPVSCTCVPFEREGGVDRQGNGWYRYDGSTAGGDTAPRNVCTKLALITDPVTNESIPWTERLKGPIAQLPRTYTAAPVSLPYGYNEIGVPYGAAEAAVNIAGMFSICTGGATPGKSCVTPTEQENCVKNGGECGPLALANETVRGIAGNELRVPNASPHGGAAYDTKQTSEYNNKTSAEGLAELNKIYARTYGVWEWQKEVSECVQYCQGGVYRLPKLDASGNELPAERCTSNDQCLGPVGKCDPYTGEPGVKRCFGGAKDGELCTNDPTICAALDADGQSGTCTLLSDRKMCNGGRNNGYDCTEDPSLCEQAGQCTFPGGGSCQVGVAAYQLKSVGRDVTKSDGTAPVIRAAQYDAKTQTYFESKKDKPAVNGITIETWTDGERKIPGTAAALAAKFYAYNANGQQMPLKRIAIDWGDGTDPSVSKGSFKNHKNICGRYCSYSVDANGAPTVVDNSVDRYTQSDVGKKDVKGTEIIDSDVGKIKRCERDSECTLSGFCNAAIGECRAKPRQCSKAEDCGTNAIAYCRGGTKHGDQCATPGSTSECPGGECIANTCRINNWGDDVDACVQDAVGAAAGYFVFTHVYRCEWGVSRGWNATKLGCEFKPKAQVLDNWGWCNGGCDPAKGGCYNNPSGTALCDTDPRAWAEFQGTILVQPPRPNQ